MCVAFDEVAGNFLKLSVHKHDEVRSARLVAQFLASKSFRNLQCFDARVYKMVLVLEAEENLLQGLSASFEVPYCHKRARTDDSRFVIKSDTSTCLQGGVVNDQGQRL